MKLVMNSRSSGIPVPKLFNPVVMLGVAILLCCAAVGILIGATACVVFAPFSWLATIKVE